MMCASTWVATGSWGTCGECIMHVVCGGGRVRDTIGGGELMGLRSDNRCWDLQRKVQVWDRAREPKVVPVSSLSEPSALKRCVGTLMKYAAAPNKFAMQIFAM